MTWTALTNHSSAVTTIMRQYYPALSAIALPAGAASFDNQITRAFNEMVWDIENQRDLDATLIPDAETALDQVQAFKALEIIFSQAAMSSNDPEKASAALYFGNRYRECIAQAKFDYDLDEDGEITEDSEDAKRMPVEFST